MSETNGKKRLQHWHVVTFFLALYDIISVNLAYFLVLWVRFDCAFSKIDKTYLASYIKFVPIYSVICAIVYVRLRLYKSIWQFAGFSELIRAFFACCITGITHIFLITILFCRMPISYYVFGCVVQFIFTVAIRFSYRFILLERTRRLNAKTKRINVMVIGAGSAGQLIIKDIKKSCDRNYNVCCIIDDNRNKWGRYVDGIPVTGGRDDILYNVDKYEIDQILMAIPSASAKDRRDILNICKESSCELKILPSIFQMIHENVGYAKMKEVDVEDLLGREEIKVNNEEILGMVKGKVILITGGGGSIGSELSRQIAKHNPEHLIILDIYENNSYDIEQELRRTFPNLNLTVLIGSVRDTNRINWVFETYKPDYVYHAAAHKHVPLMETSPCEAIKNNVIGTYKTAYAALMNGCKRFVLISTDKAVNPTNVMGASKRICEMIIQSMDQISKSGEYDKLPLISAHNVVEEKPSTIWDPVDSPAVINKSHDDIKHRTEFVAVRFGNVLGSNGSVIPLFKKQIAAGGPVTVTHSEIIRYFMTIPEAVSLVLQAGVYARGGEIFVFDMGEPVKIDTLARNLIKLMGYKPDEDIQIVYTGLRPGEKLYEEKLMAEEGMKKTKNKLIHIGKPVPFDMEKFFEQLERLAKASYGNESNIAVLVEEIVPTYQRRN